MELRDAIVFSTWSWETFNVPERVALALASHGSRVLYCEMPVSHFRRHGKALTEVEGNLYAFGPEYGGAKFNDFPLLRDLQWKSVSRQIVAQAAKVGLRDPLFVYSHVNQMAPLCRAMRAQGFPLIHICMDYPESYQYELIELAQRTLVIPKSVFHKLKAKYGEKIEWIPQSIHLPVSQTDHPPSGPAELMNLPRPRLGYLGPVFARLNLDLLGSVLSAHPEWQFIYFDETDGSKLKHANAHNAGWHSPETLSACGSWFDAGVMPYDCFTEKNLHCSPLKLFDYFLAGIPVVSTPILSAAEYSELLYLGETPQEFADAIALALAEPPDSPKRRERMKVAREHSTTVLGQRLAEVLKFTESLKGPH